MRILLFDVKQKGRGGRCTPMPPVCYVNMNSSFPRTCAIAAAARLAAEASEFCDQSAMHEGKSREPGVFIIFSLELFGASAFEQKINHTTQIILVFII